MEAFKKPRQKRHDFRNTPRRPDNTKKVDSLPFTCYILQAKAKFNVVLDFKHLKSTLWVNYTIMSSIFLCKDDVFVKSP